MAADRKYVSCYPQVGHRPIFHTLLYIRNTKKYLELHATNTVTFRLNLVLSTTHSYSSSAVTLTSDWYSKH